MEKLIGRREYGNSSLGIPFAGRWVLRDEDGGYVAHGRYRNDLIAAYGNIYEIEFVEA
jgi:hypothetical protein